MDNINDSLSVVKNKSVTVRHSRSRAVAEKIFSLKCALRLPKVVREFVFIFK